MKFNFKNKSITMNIVDTHDDIEIGLKPKKFQKKQHSTPIKSTLYFPKSHSFSNKTKIKITKTKLKSSIMQNCSVISKYRNDKTGNLKNLEYIQKEGKALNGEKPELYGSEINEEEYKKKSVDKNWRIIISPQQNNIDLNTLTKSFIEKLEFETGYKFTWIAANHYDTDNFHTHLLINGIDKNGRDVRFLPREKVSQMFRQYAQTICTQMVGYRTPRDIDEDYNRMERKNYLTKLDKTLVPYITNNTLNRGYLKSKHYVNLTNRLKYLQEIGLCEYKKEIGTYTFKNGWIEQLRLLGKYNTFYEGFKYVDCTADKYSLHDPKKDGPVTGKIKKIFTMQKNSNNFAVVLETKEGRGVYVPLNFYPENCHDGDNIKIEVKNNRAYINNFNRKK